MPPTIVQVAMVWLSENYYPLAVTVFICSLVYLLVFDEKVVPPVPPKTKGREKPTAGVVSNERVVSNLAKDKQAEKDALAVAAAEREELNFLHEERERVKDRGPAPAPASQKPALAPAPVSAPAPVPAPARAPALVPEPPQLPAPPSTPVKDAEKTSEAELNPVTPKADIGSTLEPLAGTLMAVPNAFVYGITFGNVNLFSPETPTSPPQSAVPVVPETER